LLCLCIVGDVSLPGRVSESESKELRDERPRLEEDSDADLDVLSEQLMLGAVGRRQAEHRTALLII